ncbi:MAG TPA: amidase family protein, partial [Planctomycetaceae bacterium]|nr:amidase family protein [Planctomycetaceae bacterium]
MESLIGNATGELLKRLAARDISSTELTRACLDQIALQDESIGAFLHADRDDALAQAEAVDQKRTDGSPVGLLAGLPVAMKDVVCERDKPCTCGSRMLENFRPPYDATIVQKLKAADAVILGRTNMDEFAMGSSTENSAFKVTHNPWNLAHTPGGSSGGSAAAVGGMMVPLAIGSDTGGSIRQPASFCGVVGMKPTYGRVSRYGLVAFASSLDQLGPFSNDVTGAAALLQTMAGHDPLDSTSINQPVPDYLASLEEPLQGLRVGVVEEYSSDGLHEDVAKTMRESLDVYRALGAEVKTVSLPHSKYAVATYYVIAPSEASSNLSRYDGAHFGHRAELKEGDQLIDMYCKTRDEGFGAEVKRR